MAIQEQLKIFLFFFKFFIYNIYNMYTKDKVTLYHRGPAVQPQWGPNGTVQSQPKLSP